MKVESCLLKLREYVNATPSEFRQSYFLNIPYNEETKTCEYEWKREIKRATKNWKDKITEQVYQALINYKVEIDD